MLRLTEIRLSIELLPKDQPEHSKDDDGQGAPGHDPVLLRRTACERLGIGNGDLVSVDVFRRGYDARGRGAISFVYTLDVETTRDAELLARFADDPHVRRAPDMAYRPVARARRGGTDARPIVVGAGPCGLFAALNLAQMGFRPIVVERGKVVRERTVDTFGLWRRRKLHPESNVQFGEGGAGTFSDGKLYSQVRDPKHHGRKVLEELVAAGAPSEILYVSKPHVGTFRLVKVVEALRAKIEALGGTYRFGTRLADVELEELANGPGGVRKAVRGVRLEKVGGGSGAVDHGSVEEIRTDHLVLAIGHSARDTFARLDARGVFLEPKPFSVGFRVEHPQSLIDRLRFGRHAGHPVLGAADYRLVHHCKNGRSVYSFCMCPGGSVVAATSEEGRVVTNGMSQYQRSERNANAGIVVGITPDDYPGGPLAGVDFQRRLEEQAFALGGRSYDAPAQLVGDFLAGRPSKKLGSVEPSYKPGVALVDLAEALPPWAIEAIREAMPAFGRKLEGFDMHDALFTGVETRTSSPLRIRRDDATYQSVNVEGLYPAGEGAGYAGGILSAAIDGLRVSEALALRLGTPI